MGLAFGAIAWLGACAAAAEVDVAADTYHIVDGDTIDAFPVGRIRVADIDTPESGQPGYGEAKAAMRDYVEGQRIYLDVDDVDVEDSYQRLVAVVYVRHNTTHLINVNRALVDSGLAVVDDYPNEFDPATWPRYIELKGQELPVLWGEAHAEYRARLAQLTAAQAALEDAEADLGAAQEARDAALAELWRVSALVNGTLPASAEAIEELNATRAARDAATAALEATRLELNQTQGALAAAQQEAQSERAGGQAAVTSANAASSLAIGATALAAAGAAALAFLMGRRMGPR